MCAVSFVRNEVTEGNVRRPREPGGVFLLLVSLSLGRKFYSKKFLFPFFGLPFLSRSRQDPFCILAILKHSNGSWGAF